MSKSGILCGTETLQNANEANTNCVFSQLVKLPVFTVTSSLLLSSLGFIVNPQQRGETHHKRVHNDLCEHASHYRLNVRTNTQGCKNIT